MAAGSNMSGLFAFIRQAADQLQPTASMLSGYFRERETCIERAVDARTHAEQMLSRRDELQEQINREQQHYMELSSRKRHLNTDSKRDQRREEEEISSQLERCRQRLAQLEQGMQQAESSAEQYKAQARQYDSRAQELEGYMDSTRDKCSRVADSLNGHADAITNEAGRARNQAGGFSAMNSNRFGASATDAANQRYQYAQKLDSISEQTRSLAKQYRLLSDNLGDWSLISGEHGVAADMSATNPNYSPDSYEWSCNCQRCVPTYEMRRRGYDVTAQPTPGGTDHLSYHPYDAWENPQVHACSGSGLSDIQGAMSGWGDGARAQVVVYWKGGAGGHTFSAEQIGGRTVFVDPQTNDTYEAKQLFSYVEPGQTSFCRVDNLKPSKRMLQCCKEA